MMSIMKIAFIFCFGISAAIARLITDATVSKSDNRCPERFVYIAGKCFWFYRALEPVNREKASAKCKAVNAHLAHVSDASTQDELTKWINRHEYSQMSYWIGLIDSNGNSAYHWNDDTSDVMYTSWGQDQPATDSSRKCVVMSPGASHDWKSVSCSERNLFICETEAAPSQRAVMRRVSGLSSFCNRRLLGYYAHPTDCNKYILCYRNQMRALNCANGEVFNPRRMMCTKYSDDVVCNVPTTPKTTTTAFPPEYEYDYDDYDEEEETGNNEDIETEVSEEQFQEYPDLTCEDSSYKKLGKRCYKIFLETSVWSKANEICIGDEKGQLVVIKASWEQEFIYKELRKALSRVSEHEKVYDFWIGLNDQKTADTYVWSDGGTLSKHDYQYWKSSARRRLKHLKKCVEITMMSRGKWEDNICFNDNGYICEKAAVPSGRLNVETRGKSALVPKMSWSQPSPYCGTSRRPDVPEAVIGGVRADMAQHPWQASLRSSGEHRCGGTLIGKCWVLTAAHCVHKPNTSRLSTQDKLPTLVVLGDYDTSQPEGTEIYSPILKSIVHPDYTVKPVPTNDIALVKLADCVDDLNPICLPGKNFEGFSPGDFCKVAGWGTMDSELLDFPAELQEAELPLLSQAVCKTKYVIRGRSAVQDSMLCAGRLDGGVDTCQGDSGGPLVCKKLPSDEKSTLWGVVSWGFGCAKKDRPGVYTRVSSYMDWIRNHTKIEF